MPTVFVTSLAGDEVEPCSNAPSRTPSPAVFVVDDDLSVHSFPQVPLAASTLGTADMQRPASKARKCDTATSRKRVER
jgi:hypothetical protein